MFLFDTFPIKSYSFNKVSQAFDGLGTEGSLEGRELEPRLDIVIKRNRQSILLFHFLVGFDLCQSPLVPTIINLALVYVAESKYAVALSYYQQALQLLENTHGAKSYELVAVLRNIASVHVTQKQYNDAITIYQRILLIQEHNSQNKVRLAGDCVALVECSVAGRRLAAERQLG